MKKQFQIFFFCYILFGIFFGNVSNVFAQTDALPAAGQNPYTQKGSSYTGVSDQIKKFLCAPSDNNNISGDANIVNGSTVKISGQGDLYSCINKLYRFAIIVGATISVFFIVIAGYLYMSAEGNNESVSKAKDILTTSLTGLVLLMGGYLLLKTINPDLVKFPTLRLPSVALDAAEWNTYSFTSTRGGGGAGNSTQTHILAGYNIGPYATASNHEALVTQIYNDLKNIDFSSPQTIDSYLKKAAPKTPLTGSMILASAAKYNVDAKLMVAIMQTDSSLGTKGLGAQTFNPGNVGNDDAGNKQNFGTWDKGVDAVASWLNKFRA